MTMATPLFKTFKAVMFSLSLETCKANLNYVALTVLQLLAFNTETGLID